MTPIQADYLHLMRDDGYRVAVSKRQTVALAERKPLMKINELMVKDMIRRGWLQKAEKAGTFTMYDLADSGRLALREYLDAKKEDENG